MAAYLCYMLMFLKDSRDSIVFVLYMRGRRPTNYIDIPEAKELYQLALSTVQDFIILSGHFAVEQQI